MVLKENVWFLKEKKEAQLSFLTIKRTKAEIAEQFEGAENHRMVKLQ